jgi:hypothetical protein
MYRVTTFNLGPDGRRGSTTSEEMDRGPMTAAELGELLEAFTEIDAVQNEDLDPQIMIAVHGIKLVIRTSRGRLQVYDGKNPEAPAQELTVREIFGRLDQLPASPQRAPSPSERTPSAPHRGIAFVMLLVGLALNAYILYSVFYVESVNKKPDIVLITDADEARARQAALVGTYATGSRTGDRVIEVEPDNHVRFYEVGAKGPINDSRDSYRLGRHDGLLCLSTAENGVIDLVGDTLVYYRDVYQRRRPST